MGSCFAKELLSLPCANGMLFKGARVQTQYTRSEGGDDLWYTGTVRSLLDIGSASIEYDDGDRWSGNPIYVYMLPPGAPAHTSPQPYGAPSQGASVLPPTEGAQLVMGTVVAAVPATAVGRPMW